MSKDGRDDKSDDNNNVVHLGTGDMAAIGKALRDMYECYLYSKPPERLQRLVEMIARAGDNDQNKPSEPQQPSGPQQEPAAGAENAEPAITRP
jgi:hypothetical protein